MPVPQINLVEAFAIGIPLGIAGFAVQEAIVRRRGSRSPDERSATPKSDFGPREKATGAGSDDAESVTPELPMPVTRPSRTRPKRPITAAPEQAPVVTPELNAPAAPAEAVIPAPAIAVEPPAATAEDSHPPVPASTKSRTATAKQRPALAEAVPKATPPKALLKREGDLDAALEAVVDFVDGQPRRARAEACADAIAGLVPKARRGPAQTRFDAAVKSGTAPGQLQDLAEAVGIELARALHAVREETKTYS